ncbi:MarR family transcriptional regulator [Patescibacteria group bacterium]|nr:MarR family transcriptional regulator [Patescibacteria group bacterium]
MNTDQITNYATQLQTAIGNLRRGFFSGEKDEKGEKDGLPARAEYHFLFMLAGCQKGGPVTPSDIAKIMGVSLAAITHHMNSLEEQGLIEREMAEDDRRVIHVRLSKKGEETVQLLKKKFNLKMQRLVRYLGETESRQLIELLNKIVRFREEADA